MLDIEVRTADNLLPRASLDTLRTSLSGSMSEAIQPDIPPSTTSDLVDRYLKKLGSKYKRYFNKLVFEQQPSYYMKMKHINVRSSSSSYLGDLTLY